MRERDPLFEGGHQLPFANRERGWIGWGWATLLEGGLLFAIRSSEASLDDDLVSNFREPEHTSLEGLYGDPVWLPGTMNDPKANFLYKAERDELENRPTPTNSPPTRHEEFLRTNSTFFGSYLRCSGFVFPKAPSLELLVDRALLMREFKLDTENDFETAAEKDADTVFQTVVRDLTAWDLAFSRHGVLGRERAGLSAWFQTGFRPVLSRRLHSPPPCHSVNIHKFMTAVRKWSDVGREVVGSCFVYAFLPQVSASPL